VTCIRLKAAAIGTMTHTNASLDGVVVWA